MASIGRLQWVKISRCGDVRKQPRHKKTFNYFRYVIEVGYWPKVGRAADIEARLFEKRGDNCKFVFGRECALAETQIG